MSEKPLIVEQVLGDKWAKIEPMLRELSPDLLRYIRDFAYQEVYGRPGLGLKDRELIALTALTMQGLESQLKTHVYGALNTGWTADEIREAFIHMALFAGFPTALAGLQVAHEVLEKEKAKS
jgi:4-carboxymuconolactone decarboxylase